MSGFVYVVRSSNGLLKIGFTNDPKRRLAMLRTSTADTLTLLGIIPATQDHERILHSLFHEHHVAREWFSPAPIMQPLLDGLRPIRQRQRRRAAPLVANGWVLRLAAAIRADGRSYRSISLQSGLGPNFIHQVLKTGKTPSAQNLAKIAETLGVNISTLFEAAA